MNLPPYLEWPGRSHFKTYAAAFVFFLNSIRIQYERFGEIHESYISVYEEDFVKPLRQINISQSDYHAGITTFYNRTEQGNIYMVPIPSSSSYTRVVEEANGTLNITCTVNFTAPKARALRQGYRNMVKPQHIARVEMRMLIPALKPYEWNFLRYPEREFNLSIYDSSSDTKLSEHKAWLPPTKTKWISISSKNLTDIVKLWYGKKEKTWAFNIRGIPIHPHLTYLNLVLDLYPKVCRSMISNRLDQRTTELMGQRCYERLTKHHNNCTWLRQNSLGRVKKNCCMADVHLDSEEMNQFGLDLSLLSSYFYAPVGLKYSFCQSTDANKNVDCIPTNYDGRAVLTASWNPLLTEFLEQEWFTKLSATECSCHFC